MTAEPIRSSEPDPGNGTAGEASHKTSSDDRHKDSLTCMSAEKRVETTTKQAMVRVSGFLNEAELADDDLVVFWVHSSSDGEGTRLNCKHSGSSVGASREMHDDGTTSGSGYDGTVTPIAVGTANGRVQTQSSLIFGISAQLALKLHAEILYG